MLTYGSVCSGIEAATQAWHGLGWKPSFFSEIEDFPRAALKHHYPEVPLHGDFTTIEAGQYRPIDLLVGGTPCQSFSLAGLRGGLGDDRGNLALEYLRLADRLRPRWLVWENVPGVLSSVSHDAPDPCPPEIDLDGDDGPEDGEEVVVIDEYEADESHALWCFMAGAAELGYHGGYRVIDAQYTRTRSLPWAVPQRRRRVIFVGYLGDWRRAAAVLFDRESLSGNPPPRREAGQNSAPTLAARTRGGGGLGTDFDLDGGLVANSGDVSYCISASGQQSLDAETETLVAHSLRGEGFDASEDGTGRGTPIVPVAFAQNQRDEVRTMEVAGALAAEPGMKQQTYLAQPYSIMPMNSGKDYKARETDVAQPLMAGGPVGGNQGGDFIAQVQNDHAAVAWSEELTASVEVAGTIQHGGAGGRHDGVFANWAVRRLTPVECERLMGFPDNFTNIPWRGKDTSPDGRRYKALGNSMAVNVMQWLGERIDLVESICADIGAAKGAAQ